MAVTSGRVLSLAIESATPGTYTTIASSLDATFSIANSNVPSTTKDSAGFREFVAGAGETTIDVSGNFLLDDSASQDLLLAVKYAAALKNFRVTTVGGIYTGAFLVSSISFSGANNDTQKMSLSLQGSGQPTVS